MLGKYDEKNRYLMDVTVPCYDVDARMRLRPASFMDLTQEIAYQAATVLGFGYDDLSVNGHAWVLSRMHFEILKYPVWREDVKLYTWHKGPYGPFYLRDFKLTDQEGTPMILGTSSWVILNVKERTMCRPSEIQELIPGSSVCPDHAIEKPADRVMLPRGVEPDTVGRHVVEFSDVDLLGHTNNARYVVWAMDCIDFEDARDRDVTDLSVAFNHETKAGEEISLKRVVTDNEDGSKTYYIEGDADGKSAFCVKINMK